MTLFPIAGVIDTSSIIHLRTDRYAPDVFPTLNRNVASIAATGAVLSIQRVIDELADQAENPSKVSHGADMPTLTWAKDTFKLVHQVVPLADYEQIIELTHEIAREHKRWSSNETDADPMVIASAEVLRCAVISGELATQPRAGDAEHGEKTKLERDESGLIPGKRKIPDVCMERGIPHLDLLAFFRSQHWSF